MSKYVDKVTYTLDLAEKLADLSPSEKKQTLEEVGQYLVEQILESVSRSKTTVQGGVYKSGLSTPYKKVKREQSSSVTANMELTGDMLNALTFQVKGNKVEVGIFDEDEAQKADNHNKFSSASKTTKVPQRQFIPNNKNDEVFRRDIRKEIDLIIKEAIGDGED